MRLYEFFQVDGAYSMRNLTVFITIVFGSFVVTYMAFCDTLTTEIFSPYMLAGGGVYSWGKYQDEKTKREKKDVKSVSKPRRR